MRLLLLFVCFSQAILLVSCKKYAAAGEAFFLTPDKISVKTNLLQGGGSHKITDLWVYVNGQFQGAFPVESKIPIVSKGENVSVDVFPGIKNNGLRETRIIYPFYEPLHFDTLVENGLSITRPFTFSYRAATNFTWTEDFESLGYSVVRGGNTISNFTVISGPQAFDGKSLYMVSQNGDNIIQVESSTAFNLPTGNDKVYLEINYKCNYSLLVGLIKSSGETPETFLLNPQTSWNKIYISLASTINSAPTAVKHKVYFRMIKTGDTEAEFYLDNIKLVYL